VPTHGRSAGLLACSACALVHNISLGCTCLWCPCFCNQLEYYMFKPNKKSIQSFNWPNGMGEVWTRLLEVPLGFSQRLSTFGDNSWPTDQSSGCLASLFPRYLMPFGDHNLPIRTLILVNHISILIIIMSSTSWKDLIWHLEMFQRWLCRAHLYVWFHHPLHLPYFGAYIYAFKYVPEKQG
jgi:hypothetical protein